LVRLTFGRFVFDSRLRALSRDGEAVELSPKAFSLLEVLVEARPAPVPREVLYDRLWPKTFVEAGNLHNLVSEIRRTIGDESHQILRTVHGVGYSFDARDVQVPTGISPFVLWIGNEAIHLQTGEAIIGRDPAVAVVIDSSNVSRQHARLFVSDDHVTIEDLGSKNGTFVGSERLSAPRVLLGVDDEIIVGKTSLLLRRRGNVESTVTTP
jgi:DNA-binding winged helix-turn-helix (wHTH) protein